MPSSPLMGAAPYKVKSVPLLELNHCDVIMARRLYLVVFLITQSIDTQSEASIIFICLCNE